VNDCRGRQSGPIDARRSTTPRLPEQKRRDLPRNGLGCFALQFQRMTEVREITRSDPILANSVMSPSVIPSAK
jgi:hypothetical protein